MKRLEKFDEKLTKFEETTTFPVSRYVWTGISIIATVIFLIGIIVLLSTFTPTTKKRVQKESIDTTIVITKTEIISCSTNDDEYYEESEPAEGIYNNSKTTSTTSKQSKVFASFDPLYKLIDSTKYSWKSKGYYEQTSWYGTKTWKITDYGITKPLQNFLHTVSPYDTTTQAQIISELALVVKPFKDKYRKKVLSYSIAWLKSTSNVTAAIDELKILSGQCASTESVTLFRKMTQFFKKNPRDGIVLAKIAGSLFNVMEDSTFNSTFKVFQDGFVYTFGGSAIDLFTNANNQFVALYKNEKVKSSEELACFYRLYGEKYTQVYQQKQNAEEEYNSNINKANESYIVKKAAKTARRVTALIVVGVSLLSFLLIAILVALFSIQRNLVALNRNNNKTEL